MTKPTLFDLNDQQKQLKDLMATAETDDQETNKLIDELFNQCKDDIRTKIDNYIYIIKDLESEVAGFEGQAEALKKKIVEPVQAKATRITKQIDRLEKTLETIARDNDNEIKGDVFKVKIQKGAYSVNITDESKIPSSFKSWALKLEFKQSLFTAINTIFEQYQADPKLTATNFLNDLIESMKLKPAINKTALRDKLKNEEIAGAELRQSESMRIY